LLILVFGFFPDSVLKTNQMAAEAWLTRLLNQPVIKSNEIAGLTAAP
jgi:NADH-quinone oxidoreductase subunit M